MGGDPHTHPADSGADLFRPWDFGVQLKALEAASGVWGSPEVL